MSDRGTLYTYSGKIAFPGGAPSLLDTAIALSREGRFAGAGQRFFPSGIAYLCCLLICFLLFTVRWFDSTIRRRSITGDTPKPAKTDEIEAFEEELLRGIYASHGVTFPYEHVRKAVKKADRKAMRGEVYTVGNIWLQPFHVPCLEAEELIFKYVKEYTYADMLEASGRVPLEFMRRFRQYRLQLDASRIIS